ncbi:hypothetical protein GQ600_15814 [Phytophthora cactorum]|nr:hypothetical protein GQ600_15814 [Phytophthora cactorum]
MVGAAELVRKGSDRATCHHATDAADNPDRDRPRLPRECEQTSSPHSDNDEWTWGSVKRRSAPMSDAGTNSEEEKVETRSTSYLESTRSRGQDPAQRIRESSKTGGTAAGDTGVQVRRDRPNFAPIHRRNRWQPNGSRVRDWNLTTPAPNSPKKPMAAEWEQGQGLEPDDTSTPPKKSHGSGQSYEEADFKQNGCQRSVWQQAALTGPSGGSYSSGQEHMLGSQRRRKTFCLVNHYVEQRAKSVKATVPVNFWVGPPHIKTMAMHAREIVFVLDVTDAGSARTQSYAYEEVNMDDNVVVAAGTVRAIPSDLGAHLLREQTKEDMLPLMMVLRHRSCGEKASEFDQRRRHDGGLQASATKNRSHHAEAENPMLSTLTEHDDSVKEEQDMPLAPIVSPRNLGTERVVTAPYPPEAPRKQVDVKSQIRTSGWSAGGKELENNGTQQLSTVPREVGTSDSESKRRYMDRITPQERTKRMERE